MTDKYEWTEDDENEEDTTIWFQKHKNSKSLLLSGDILEDIFEIQIDYPLDCEICFDRLGHKIEIVIKKLKEGAI